MSDTHYPTVDPDFFHQCVTTSDRFIDHIEIGNSIGYVLKGRGPMGTRVLNVRKLKNNQIGFDTATGAAIRLGFMSQLLTWFEENRGWKNGGYVQRPGV